VQPFRYFLAIAGALGLGLAACGPDPELTLANDAGSGSGAATLTTFVIDLVEHHTTDTMPTAYAEFSALPDPDRTTNNTSAYSSLFQ
jgi:hypothetical protein